MLAVLNLVILTLWLVVESVPLVADKLAQWEFERFNEDD